MREVLVAKRFVTKSSKLETSPDYRTELISVASVCDGMLRETINENLPSLSNEVEGNEDDFRWITWTQEAGSEERGVLQVPSDGRRSKRTTDFST